MCIRDRVRRGYPQHSPPLHLSWAHSVYCLVQGICTHFIAIQEDWLDHCYELVTLACSVPTHIRHQSAVCHIWLKKLILISVNTLRYLATGFDFTATSLTHRGKMVGILFLVRIMTSVLFKANDSQCAAIQLLTFCVTLFSLSYACSVDKAAMSTATSSAYPTRHVSSGISIHSRFL